MSVIVSNNNYAFGVCRVWRMSIVVFGDNYVSGACPWSLKENTRLARVRGTTVTRLTRFRAVARTRTAPVQLELRAVASALVLCSHTLAAPAT